MVNVIKPNNNKHGQSAQRLAYAIAHIIHYRRRLPQRRLLLLHRQILPVVPPPVQLQHQGWTTQQPRHHSHGSQEVVQSHAAAFYITPELRLFWNREKLPDSWLITLEVIEL